MSNNHATRRAFTLTSIVLTAFALSSFATVQAAEQPNETMYYGVQLAVDQPEFTAFWVDSLGKGRKWHNAMLGVNLKQNYQKESRDGWVNYHPSGQPDALTGFKFDASSILIRSEARTNNSIEPFAMKFNLKGRYPAFATLLGRMEKAGEIMLPAVLHIPGQGTIRITARSEKAIPLHLKYESESKFVSEEEGKRQFVKITFPAASEACDWMEFRLEVVSIYPKIEALENDARFDGYRRCWLNILQLSPERRMLANNTVSDVCSLVYHEYSEIASLTGELADGVSGLTLLRDSLNRFLDEGQLGYGMAKYKGEPYYPEASLDTWPSLLIAAHQYYQASSDQQWLERQIDKLTKWGDQSLATDKDGNGLIEYHQSGNAGDCNFRPANWWDAINFGHEDAYSNALAYRAFRGLAKMERKAGRDEQAARFEKAAQKLKAAYYKTFYNPDTGMLAGWKSRDGKLHDYAFTFIQGLAIAYGLIDDAATANKVLDATLKKIKDVGFNRFDLGLPGNLVGIPPEDYFQKFMKPRWDKQRHPFQTYENGGASANHTYYLISALYKLGRIKDGDAILLPILNSFNECGFEGFEGPWSSYDWMSWDGKPSGYEGLLVDNYLAVKAVLVRQGLVDPEWGGVAKSPCEKWEKDIQAFEAADRTNPPPENAVLFIGSSTIRMWKTLKEDFPNHTVINRGFGGSQIADSVYYADRIVIPYKPKMILLYAGGNDINAGKSPEAVFEDFKAFVVKVRAKLPAVRIAFMSSGPSLARWAQAEKQRKLNQLIKEYVGNDSTMDFIEAFDVFLGADGKPRPELYVADKLHNNAEGYKIRAELVRPYLEKVKNKPDVQPVDSTTKTLSAAADLPFPEDMECVPCPVYRHRADGQPGREITLRFKPTKLFGPAQVELTVEGRTETIDLPSAVGGTASGRVLLPPNVGTEQETPVTVTLRQGTRELKKTFKVPAMRHWTVYLYNHSHVDIGYTAPHKVVEFIHKRNIEEGIKLAEATKDYPAGSRYRWNPEITWPLERLWQTATPEQKERVLQAIRDGSLCVDASYLNLNTSVCSDEELFHAFRLSREMQRVTGMPMDTLQQIDVPGFSWGLVPVMAQEGVRYIMAWPNPSRSGSTHDNINQRPFWWVGPDGRSKVLFLQPGKYGNSGSMAKGGTTGRPWFGQRDTDKIPAVIKTGSANVDFTGQLTGLEKAKHPYDFMVLSWSLWDNNLIDADIPDAVKAWNAQYAYPRIIIAGAHEIMSTIEKKYGDQLPVVKGDFTEYWTDGLGTAARLTAINRNAKERLTQAETLWTMLRPGKSAPRAEFDEAWRYIALGSEHTWCAENPAEPYFQDAIWKVKQDYFREANDRSQTLFDEALAPATDMSKGALGPPDGPANGGVAVFNTQSWKRGGLVTLSKAESSRGDRVTDEEGKDVPAQRLSTGELIFLAKDVSAFGSRHYRVLKGQSPLVDGCKLNGTTLENQHLRVTLDSETGNITHLVNVATGKNYADAKVNGGLNAFRWIPANRYEPKADTNIVIVAVESGPLIVELRVTSMATGCRAVSRSVRLIADQPWVEISNVVDKLPLVAKDGIHFGFGFDLPQGRTRVDIPWGVMEVEKDQWPQANRNWLAIQRWLDISNDDTGVTWCSLDAPLFEYGDMTANIDSGWGNKGPWIKKLAASSTVYSWVMNNHWITNFPLTQDGPVLFRYRIWPHGPYDAAAANRFGLEQAQPLAHVSADSNPKLTPLVAVNNDRVCVTIIKSAADAKSTILRLRSLSDKPENVKLSFPKGTPKSVRLCALEEIPGEPGETISMLPHGLATVRVEFN